MAKLADLRSNLSREEREEYEKFKSNPKKIKETDDLAVVEVKSTIDSNSEIKGEEDSKYTSTVSRKLKYGRKPAAAGNWIYDRNMSNLRAHYNKKDHPEDDKKTWKKDLDNIKRSRSDYESRSRGSRRSRSRSKSRERRAKRSNSPFSVAYVNWKKFKQAEKVTFYIIWNLI